MPKLRKPRAPAAKADKTKPRKPGRAVTPPPATQAAPSGAAETIACLHCGHVNPLPGGVRPGRTVSCKLCGRMFSVEAAAAHVPPPPPEPPPPPPGMTPHTPDTESIDAPTTAGPLIYTPALAPKKKLSRAFRFTLGLTSGAFVIACGIGLAVMVPSINRMRVAAGRNTCADNFGRIARAVELYAHANHGAFPESFGRLVVAQSLPPEALVCPGGRETPAPGDTPQARAEALAAGRHASYAYTGRNLNKRGGAGAGVSAVVAYEPLSHHGDGIHVLFADGHVAFVPLPDAKRLIADLKAGKNPTGVTGY